jgi:hypothetical protein
MTSLISNLCDHIFIGYRKIILNDKVSPLSIPIIIAKDLDYNDADEYSNGLISHGSIYLDDDNDDDKYENYTLYLPYLNELIGLNKMNIYELIDDGMIFIDENGINITKLIHDNYKEINSLTSKCLNLKWEIDSKYLESKIYEFDDNFPSTLEYERLNIQIIEKNEKIRKNKIKNYNEKIVKLKRDLESNQEFKKIIQRLEYRYPTIIKPILSLINKAPRHNFINEYELLEEEFKLHGRMLEEGLKKI